MSVRAYRVKQIEWETTNSFNLWHDQALVDFLVNKGCLTGLDNDLSGLIEVPIDILKEALQNVDVNEEVKRNISKDIEVSQEQDKDYVDYYCF